MYNPPQRNPETEAPPKTAFTKRYDYDGSGNLIYEGWALANGNYATATPNWAIKKYTYTAGVLTLSQWASGTSAPVNIWDNRTTGTYQ